jgi:predicted DNA-binding transcriptional regulator YafY
VDEKSFRLLIPAIPEHEILQWVLYQAGKAEVIKPASLRSKVRKKAQKIADNHRK